MLANTWHSAKTCCAAFRCSLHDLHRLRSVSPLSFFQGLISIICSVIDVMADVLPGVKFYFSQIRHLLTCFLYISFCISYLLYCSSFFFSLSFLRHSFTSVHVNSNYFSSFLLLILFHP